MVLELDEVGLGVVIKLDEVGLILKLDEMEREIVPDRDEGGREVVLELDEVEREVVMEQDEVAVAEELATEEDVVNKDGAIDVVIAVGECGGAGVGAVSTEAVRRADAFVCRAAGCADDSVAERGHMTDAAWSCRVTAGECCIEGGSLLGEGIAFGTETLGMGEVGDRAERDGDEQEVAVGSTDANDGDSDRRGATVGARRGVRNGSDNVGVVVVTLLSCVLARIVSGGGRGSDDEALDGGRGVGWLCCFDSCIRRPRTPRKCRYIPDAVWQKLHSTQRLGAYMSAWVRWVDSAALMVEEDRF